MVAFSTFLEQSRLSAPGRPPSPVRPVQGRPPVYPGRPQEDPLAGTRPRFAHRPRIRARREARLACAQGAVDLLLVAER